MQEKASTEHDVVTGARISAGQIKGWVANYRAKRNLPRIQSNHRNTTTSNARSMHTLFTIMCWSMVISTSTSNAAKILILPAPGYSSCRTIASIGEELLEHKHNVSIVLAGSSDFAKCTDSSKMRLINFPSQSGVEVGHLMTSMTGSVSEKSDLANVLDIFNSHPALSNVLCRAVFGEATFVDKLRNEQFDLMLVDGMFHCHCYFVLPYILGIPYISVSTSYINFITGQPFIPSIHPFSFMQYTDKMTLIQRMINAIVSVMFHVAQPRFLPMDMINNLVPNMTAWDVINLASKAELFLENKDHLLDFAKPLPDSHIMVGGLTARPPKPLPRDLHRFVEYANGSVIIVSFGSILTIESMPEDIIEMLSLSLQRVSARVVWKRKNETAFANIKAIEWLPQNDLVGHRNVKLFISHCGNNGMYESLYHGVPILCMPFLNDQFANAACVKERGFGLMVNLAQASQGELSNKLNEMMTNRVYENNIKLASKIFHDREHGPRQRAAFWIDHVIKYGGKHLRSRAVDIPVYQYMSVDIYAIIASVVCVIVYICYRIIYIILKLCYEKFLKRKMKYE